jgi:hypothetical protein
MNPERSPIERDALPLARCPEAVWERAHQPRPQRRVWVWAAAVVVAMLAAYRSSDAWVESGRIQIGDIGVVDVQPGSRVRVLKASATEHRLELASGAIEAEINAPPRLFFVDAPAGTAIDLGCKYRMETDEAGNGLLRVTGGWVALGERLIPAGASCRTRAGERIGTPLFDDAPAALRTALDEFDETGRGLDAVLTQARTRDTLTLWHLLQEVPRADRGEVFDRMEALTPVPTGVTREAALALDNETLRKWREELAWTW